MGTALIGVILILGALSGLVTGLACSELAEGTPEEQARESLIVNLQEMQTSPPKERI